MENVNGPNPMIPNGNLSEQAPVDTERFQVESEISLPQHSEGGEGFAIPDGRLESRPDGGMETSFDGGFHLSNSESDEAAELADFQSFDLRSVPVDRIVGFIVSAVLISGATVGLCFLFFAVGLGVLFCSVLAGAIVIALILLYLAAFWPAIEHRNRAWRLTDVGLEFRHGVWWKHQQAIPWARVQHADVSQGPLQRMYGIGTLTVHTAGTKDSSVNLEGLAHETAVQLRDEVIRQRKSSDVV
jgi:membrane protein YdbS with pleckstrin-like domain